uniref:Zinc finger RING-type eukaryotic domain-containing protein n=1 Tax=Callorhinchus milii TaxID=7868 RepID=A0A4W3GKB1_CALMI
ECSGNMRPEAARSICLEFYTDPVTADCGHKFCRACTLQSWGTLQQIPQRNIRPNRFVSNIVKSIERLSLNPRLEETGYQSEDHEEKLNLFCETEQRSFCGLCAMSRKSRFPTPYVGKNTSLFHLQRLTYNYKMISLVLDSAKRSYFLPSYHLKIIYHFKHLNQIHAQTAKLNTIHSQLMEIVLTECCVKLVTEQQSRLPLDQKCVCSNPGAGSVAAAMLGKCRRTERPCHMAVLMLQNEILQRCQTSGI